MTPKECLETEKKPEHIYPDEKPVVNINLSICSPEDRPRMIALVNRLAKSPQGLEALTIAAENGYRFNFMAENRSSNGVTNFRHKRISLNPHRSDDKLIGTLCHECRHAVQNTRSSVLNDEDQWDVRSNLRYNRAMEADAQACAVTACKELALQGDDKPYQEFKTYYPEIEQAFDQAYQAAGNKVTKDVMTKAFEGWYDQSRIMTLYEQSYLLRRMANDLKWTAQGTQGRSFDHTVSAQQTIKEITQTKDGNYFTDDPEILNGGKYMAVTENTMDQMKKYVDYRKELTGKDLSEILDGIPTRANVTVPDMIEITKPEKREGQNSVARIALMQRLTSKKRR